MKYGFFCFCMALSISLAGCSQVDIAGSGITSHRATDVDSSDGIDGSFLKTDSIKQCVNAAYRDEDLGYGITYFTLLMRDTLYYWNGVSVDGLLGNVHVYRETAEGPGAVELELFREKMPLFYTVDQEQNLYYLYLEYSEDGNSLFLQKKSSYGITVYDLPVAPAAEAQILEEFYQKGYTYQQGTVSADGTLLLGNMEGEFFLFDEKGEFICSGRDNWLKTGEFIGRNKGFLNAGGQGIFAYAISGQQLLLSEINTENGEPGPFIKVTVDTEDPFDVYSGYERGILLSDGNSMWAYDPEVNELETLFQWGDPDLRMSGCHIYGLGLPDEDRLYVIADYKGTTKEVYIKIP